jgi:hypothetical protein
VEARVINEVNQNHLQDQIQLAKSSVRQYLDQEEEDYEEDFYQAKEEETPIKNIHEESMGEPQIIEKIAPT